MTQNAAMLWTGGKDSALALYEASQNGCCVHCLVTFAPPEPKFLAHPLAFIKLQAQALELPHYVLSIRDPFEKSYESALGELRDKMGVNTVITGDIAEVAGRPNWIRERSRPIGMAVQTPLWGRGRLTLLQQLLDNGFQVLFSCIKTGYLDENWIGRELNHTAIAALQADLTAAVRKAHELELQLVRAVALLEAKGIQPATAESRKPKHTKETRDQP